MKEGNVTDKKWVIHLGHVAVSEHSFSSRQQARDFARRQKAEGWKPGDIGIYRSINGVLQPRTK